MQWTCITCGKGFEKFGWYSKHVKKDSCSKKKCPKVEKKGGDFSLVAMVNDMRVEIQAMKSKMDAQDRELSELRRGNANIKRSLYQCKKKMEQCEKNYQAVLRTKKEIQHEEFMTRLRACNNPAPIAVKKV